ncbi:hypothetical protein S40293_10486 [Stachybotrys chartarum IBT 40293]|nr:hypothetical protein S40293_10486 [Stachybotrys chartarum IBT 40293]
MHTARCGTPLARTPQNPDPSRHGVGSEFTTLSAATVTSDLHWARNTLKKRTHGPVGTGRLELNFSRIANGDGPGPALFRSHSARVGIARDGSTLSVQQVTGVNLATGSVAGSQTLAAGIKALGRSRKAFSLKAAWNIVVFTPVISVSAIVAALSQGNERRKEAMDKWAGGTGTSSAEFLPGQRWASPPCSGTIDFGDNYVLTSLCLLADDDNLDSSSNDLPSRMNAFHLFIPLGADVGPATPTGSGRWLTLRPWLPPGWPVHLPQPFARLLEPNRSRRLAPNTGLCRIGKVGGDWGWVWRRLAIS